VASFGAVALAEMLLGAGSAFVSGADRALLWTSLGESGRQAEYPRWEGRLRAASQTSEAVSAAAGGWLYALAPRLPFWFQLPTAVAGLAAVVALRETPRPRTHPARSHVRQALHLVRFTLWRHRRLQAAMALSVALGLASFVMVWLIQPYLQLRGVPPIWFGPIWAGAHVWLAAASLVSARVTAGFGLRATLVGCCLLVPMGYAGLAASASAWGAAFYLCFMTLRGLQGPTLATLARRRPRRIARASCRWWPCCSGWRSSPPGAHRGPGRSRRHRDRARRAGGRVHRDRLRRPGSLRPRAPEWPTARNPI
jgi:hypothetical protein